MRVLAASTGGVGHFEPMSPFISACVEAGHEVLVAVPEGLADAVRARGWPLAVLPPTPPDVLGRIFGSLPQLPKAEADRVVMRDVFGGANVDATLPEMERVLDAFAPDLVLREPAELSSYVAASRRGVEQVQVAIGLVRLDDLVVGTAGAAVEERHGVPAAGLRAQRTLSLLPVSFEGAVPPGMRERERYRGPDPVPGALPDALPADDRPLVYVTFGSVAGGLGFYPEVYRSVLDALADLPVRVLMTIGRAADPDRLGVLPPNAVVEPWWPQDAAVAASAVVVGHGGFGTTTGALRAGVPQVVLPLFSSDQFLNADAVAASGAGVAATTPDDVAAAVRRLLDDDGPRGHAQRVAREISALPSASAWISRA